MCRGRPGRVPGFRGVSWPVTRPKTESRPVSGEPSPSKSGLRNELPAGRANGAPAQVSGLDEGDAPCRSLGPPLSAGTRGASPHPQARCAGRLRVSGTWRAPPCFGDWTASPQRSNGVSGSGGPRTSGPPRPRVALVPATWEMKMNLISISLSKPGRRAGGLERLGPSPFLLANFNLSFFFKQMFF